METTIDHKATYSPEDNKLRMYPACRLDSSDYKRFRLVGFKYAPKQGLFVAPAWSPEREDLLIEFCGHIEDEDTSLLERATERADRFHGYSGNSSQAADAAHKNVQSICENIPMGQPILVGHHSEARSRRDVKRIDDGMRNAVKLWEKSEYWERRATAALAHAKFKGRPDVRVNRIKRIEADNRRMKAYYTPFPADQEPFMIVAWNENEPTLHVMCGKGRGASAVKVSNLESIERHYSRWIAHNNRRLIYEKAMLEGQGASDLLKPKKRPKQPPLYNYKAPEGLKIENKYFQGEFIHYQALEMTKEEYKNLPKDYKGTRVIEGSHRVRIAVIRGEYYCVFLTDSKSHKRPTP